MTITGNGTAVASIHGAGVRAEFERTPPHDRAAEQCVLGGMMLSKDAIADVTEVITPADHYRPAHQIVHEAILGLYGHGEPVDAVTVAAELTRRGEIARMGGAPYLHTLIAAIPTAANAGYYARIVRRAAVLRRMIEAGTRLVQYGYSEDADPDALVSRAQEEVLGLSGPRPDEDYRAFGDLIPAALLELEAMAAAHGLRGVPTGFADLDALTCGLQAGQMITVAARPALGKALSLDTELPTPDGWTTMGAVKAGDLLIGGDGTPTRVLAVTDVMQDRPCYEVRFDDGTVILADADHQWQTETRAFRRQRAARRSAWYWPESSRRRLREAHAAALLLPDGPVTAREVIEGTGPEFRNVMTVAGRGLDAAPFRLPVTASGNKRTYTWHAPAFASRHAILAAMAERVDKPMNAAAAAAHDPIVTTAQIAETLRVGSDGRLNHAIPTAPPLQLAEAALPLPPYVLGVWLGDGSSDAARFTSADPEVATLIEAEGIEAPHSVKIQYGYGLRYPDSRQAVMVRGCVGCGKPFTPATSEVVSCGRSCGGRARSLGYRRHQPTCRDCGEPFTGATSGHGICRACLDDHGTVQAVLRKLGVLGNKHIPPPYLRASEAQRRALLAGLLDTDGTVMSTGSVQLSVTSRRLAEDFRELVSSLGYRSGWYEKPVKGRTAASSVAYVVTFTTPDTVFRLRRKQVAHSERYGKTGTKARQRYITAVTPVRSVPVRCLQVDSKDHLYLASRSMIPTHNTTMATDFARSAAIRHGLCTVVFSLEMSQPEIMLRILSAEAKVPLHSVRTGQLSEPDWNRLNRRVGDIGGAPLFIDDSPNMSMLEIRSKCRRLRQQHDLRLVIVDYLQLMSSPGKVENRQTEVSGISRSLKLLAKELQVPVVAVSQLNRGPEQRSDRRPLLSDLRESGSIEQDSDVVILLHREDAYDRESPRVGEADLIVAKHRNGPCATITVAFQGLYSRFVDMAPIASQSQ